MTFALITEGPSEHRIIKHILYRYFRDMEPEINQIQPKIVQGKQASIGGWNEVLKYCERAELEDILIENDYLIIQIDTDQSETKPFSVKHARPNNEVKNIEVLYNDIVTKLKDLIKPEILEEYEEKIFFAICIHTVECWLLPIYFTNKHKSKTINCLSTLNPKLRQKNIKAIPLKDKNKPTSIRTYETILKNWRKKEDIDNAAKHNYAFLAFLKSMDTILR